MRLKILDRIFTAILPNNPSVRGGPQQIMGTKGTVWAGNISSEMGYRTHPVTGAKGSYHRGTDVAAPRGTPLTANVGGKVVASGNAKSFGYDASYGNIVVVQDSSGAKHLYAHLDSASAKVGSTVKKGTLMGKIGSTGRSTGPHLHYEVSKGGKLLSGKNYL